MTEPVVGGILCTKKRMGIIQCFSGIGSIKDYVLSTWVIEEAQFRQSFVAGLLN